LRRRGFDASRAAARQDADDDCDPSDLAVLLSNFGRGARRISRAILTATGPVGLQDLTILLDNFGERLP
jgi:hypothetical protein